MQGRSTPWRWPSVCVYRDKYRSRVGWNNPPYRILQTSNPNRAYELQEWIYIEYSFRILDFVFVLRWREWSVVSIYVIRLHFCFYVNINISICFRSDKYFILNESSDGCNINDYWSKSVLVSLTKPIKTHHFILGKNETIHIFLTSFIIIID